MPTLEQRVADLEREVKEPKPKDGWDRLAAASSLIVGVTVAAVGLFTAITVDRVSKRGELELKRIQAIEKHLPNLRKGELAAEAILALYGEAAVRLLISEIDNRPDDKAPAEKTLRRLLYEAHEPTCDELGNVIASELGLHSWETHEIVIQLAGRGRCTGTMSAMGEYLELVVKAGASSPERAQLARRVRTNPALDDEAIDTLRKSLCRALDSIARTRPVLDPTGDLREENCG